MSTSLNGIRVFLSGSIPEDSSNEQRQGIVEVVGKFTAAVLQEGGTLLHGSHPTFQAPIKEGARLFVEARGGGPTDALVLVRSEEHSKTDAEKTEIEEQRKYALVHIIPSGKGGRNESLMPMRDWMADRCDVIVTIGGKWYQTDKDRSGVPKELEAALRRGRPGFIITAFGGASAGYWDDNETLKSRLQNGLSKEQNTELAECRDTGRLVSKIISQIKLLPLKRTTVTQSRLFRILALDGGGIRGTFTAAVLAQWDAMLTKGIQSRLVDHFDLVAGTSTGAILALGLGLGKSPQDILNLYRTKGNTIFPRHRNLRHWVASKHDATVLASVLKEVYQDKRLIDSSCRLVIPTVRANHGQAEAISTPHSLDRSAYGNQLAVDAALASAAAPTYFDPAIMAMDVAAQTFLDGGIWANNPVLPAIVEAVRYLGVPVDRIDVLSVGTLGHEADFTGAWEGGKARWALSVSDLFFAAQETGAGMLTDALLGQARHLRINQATPTEIPMDDPSLIKDMAERGAALAIETFPLVRSRFLDGFFAAPWKDAVL